MTSRKKIALLVGQPEENRQSAVIRRYIKQAFAEDLDVCVFAMYEKMQNTKNREKGESNIFSLVEYDSFEKIVILADSIQTPGVLHSIEEKLHGEYSKEVIFVGGDSKYYTSVPSKTGFFENTKLGQLKSRKASDIKPFDFNEGTMADHMLMQTKIQGLVDVINSHVKEIHPFETFDICLNISWSSEGFLSEIGSYTNFSDTMLHVLECSASDSDKNRADLSTEFNRTQLLPALSKKRTEPRAYFFSPLFFEDHCFGYAVINYGRTIRCYDDVYKKWLNDIMHGLECFQHFNMLDVNTKLDEYKMLDVVSDILDNNRFTYHFQPIVDVATGEIYAYEALMRTTIADPVSPLDVLGCAKHLGRLCDVEHATFYNVLDYVQNHPDLFENKKVFINSIPGVKIADDDAEALRIKTENLPIDVVIELTEQAEIDDDELEEVKRRYETVGAGIALDDYGTGYSNVYNLLRYMPDVVKIDRMLLSGIHLNSQKQHFVKEIIEFSHNNDITVLAEGVETTEELKMVIILGVDLIQGFYTARPSAEVMQSIDDNIKHEIIQYGQLALQANKRKIYEVGDEASISLVNLVSDQYSKISFTESENVSRNIEITGRNDFVANIDIEIGDSYSGTITLKDVYLSVRNEQPTIRFGNNCDVTLILEGENIIEQGGILVPESSKLTVRGAGNLNIKQIAINGYGIGNDKNEKCGDLHFEQDGLIKIQGNIVKAVGIGAGNGGNITIKSGMYAFQFIGKEAVGIGSLKSDIKLDITNCGLDFDLRCAANVGVGSMHGNADIDISHAGIHGFFSSNKCVCMGIMDGKHLKFRLIQATGDFNAHADFLCGFGSISGYADVVMNEFSFKMSVEGDKAIAAGNLIRTADVQIGGDMIADITNNIGYDIGAGKIEITSGSSEFKLNGEIIEH